MPYPRRLMAGGLGLLAAFLVTAPQEVNAETGDPALKAFDFAYNLDHDEAAAYPSMSQTEAKFALVLLYNREKKFDAVQRVLNDLKRRYPRNRLVWLESASTYLRDEQVAMAERTLQEGFAKLERDERGRMFGEEAVWRLKRGTARVALGPPDAALPDLTAARDAEASLWVTGHAHLELGKVADLEGKPSRARDEYERGRKLCSEAKHRRCVEAAEALKKNGYSPN